jgi:hypothetical protein
MLPLDWITTDPQAYSQDNAFARNLIGTQPLKKRRVSKYLAPFSKMEAVSYHEYQPLIGFSELTSVAELITEPIML